VTDRIFDPADPDGMVAVRVAGRPRYAMVPEWLVDPDRRVSDRAVRMWAVLWLVADWNTGIAEVSRRRLADLTGKSVDAIDRAIGDLVTAGAVTVEHRSRNGRQAWNVYTLHWEPVRDIAAPRQPRNRGGVGRGIAAPYSDPSYSDQDDEGQPSIYVQALDLVERWWAVREVPATRSLVSRWVTVAAEWIRAGGRTDDEWLRDASAAGIETPAGWTFYATRQAGVNDNRWEKVDAVIAKMAEEEAS